MIPLCAFVVDPDTGQQWPVIAGGDPISAVVGVASGGLIGGGILDSFTNKPNNDAATAGQQNANAALDTGYKASGYMPDDDERTKAQIAPIIKMLVDNSLPDDTAQLMAIVMQEQRGQSLQKSYEYLKSFSDAIQQGYFTPEDVSDVGSMLGSQLRTQYEQGQEFDLDQVLNDVAHQAVEQLPAWQRIADYAGEAAGDIRSAGRSLGEFDQDKFDRRYEPALDRLNADYEVRDRAREEDLASRGVTDQGSMASDPTIGRSTVADVARSLSDREYARELGNITKEAQAAAEGQQVAEYSALQGEPGAIGTAVAVKAGPLDKLAEIGGKAADVGLAIHSNRRQDIAAGHDATTGAGVTGAEAGAAPFTSLQPVVDNRTTRRTQSVGGALEQLSAPVSQRLGYRAGVTPGTMSGLSQVRAQGIESDTAQKLSRQKALMGLGLAGLSMVGGGGGGG